MTFKNKLPKAKLNARRLERELDFRGPYFRDTTAILHCYPFRRLKHKTQVFFSPKNDHICTRIEHVMHVASVAATICKALGLNQELAWAIGMGHDLGHAPFGHVGEHILSKLLQDRGGFSHEVYSLRVVDFLTNYGRGLNLTYAVRDGIINHCGEQFEQAMRPDEKVHNLSAINDRSYTPSTWEAVIVRMSDKIAYMGRDLEDALQLGMIKKTEIPELVRSVLGNNNSDIINTMVNDIITESPRKEAICFSDKVYEASMALIRFNYEKIYKHEILSRYHTHFERILKTLYQYLTEIFEKYGMDQTGYKSENNFLAVRFGDFAKKMEDFYIREDRGFQNIILDYLAGMTDNYAIESVNEIMVPKNFEFKFEELLFT